MQSDVPPLPIACLTNKLRLNRIKSNAQPKLVAQSIKKKSPLTSKSQEKSTSVLLPNKKRVSRPPIAGSSPYKISACLNVSDTAKSEKSVVNQRVSSAKMLRIKELQNQLTDAHFHLNELSNENKLLKAIQKRQDTALKRYEGTNAELPRIINNHHEDLRVLQSKYKKLKSDHSAASEKLKEKESELHSLQVQYKKLLQLSKDRNLGEREKLQTQVFDLTHRVNEQDETIQTLKRKLALETKYLKHQLHAEMVKHKETQKQLQETQYKLKNLEELYEQKERRSYQASRIMAYSRGRSTVTSQSLTNLSDGKSEFSVKGSSFRKNGNESSTRQSLPALNGATSTPINNQMPESPSRSSVNTPSTVNEIPFDSRLHNSPVLPRNTFANNGKSNVIVLPREEEEEEEEEKESRSASKVSYELPKSLKKELDYSSDDSSSRCKVEESEEKTKARLASRSRNVHARLVNSANEGVRPSNKTKANNNNRSRSLTKENLEDIAENDKEIKYDRDSVVTVISREVLQEHSKEDFNCADATNSNSSDVESEMEIPMDFSAEEDDNKVVRKSDVVIDEMELERQANASSHLTTLLQKPTNFLFNAKETEEKMSEENALGGVKREFKAMNGGLSIQRKMSKENINSAIDEMIARKKVVSNKIIKTSRDTDSLIARYSTGENDRQSISSQTETSDVVDQAEKLIDDIDQDLMDETIILENGLTPKSMIKPGEKRTSPVNTEKSDDPSRSKAEQKTVVSESSKSFDKAKLLAELKAIENNDNIEFLELSTRKNSASNRLRITENLYRGVPTHHSSRKKNEIMKELFADTRSDNNKKSKES